MNLAELRKARGFKQAEVAAMMGISQARVSAIEKQELTQTELRTVARYIEALGGQLRARMQFQDVVQEMRIAADDLPDKDES